MAAMDAALAGLVSTDWSGLCRTRFFCFGCASPLCDHCCPVKDGVLQVKGHRRSHHPQVAGDPLPVETISGGRLAVDADVFKASLSRYSTVGIQRIVWQGRRWILILSVGNADHHQMNYNHCDACDNLINKGSSYCSLQCRADHKPAGDRRQVAQLFAALAEQGQFGPPVLQKDRYCMICRLAFSEASCPAHPPHKHPPLYPPAGPDDVKTIIQMDGWAAIPEGQLPDDIVDNVQVLQGPGGLNAYPIHPREHPLPTLGLHLGQAHECIRPGCHEAFFGMQEFCSLRCRHLQA